MQESLSSHDRDIREPFAHRHNAFVGEQTDLPVPVARVRIAVNPVSDANRKGGNRMLHRALSFADADRLDLSHTLLPKADTSTFCS